MRTQSRLTAVLACLAVLLVALPAQAAPSQPSHATHLDQAVAQWLGSVWADLARFVTVRPGTKGHKNLLPKSSSCIDPNGCSVF